MKKRPATFTAVDSPAGAQRRGGPFIISHSTFLIAPRPRRSGMALVIVLGMLVLILILVVAFFSSVSVDLQSAKRYSSGTAAKTLADSAVSLVISQIQDATATPSLAWASQPGMIRTYNDQGAAVTAYKLYSSNQLRIDGGFGNALQAAEVPDNWAGSPTLFTDLNKPVAVAGVNHYPILDPAAVAKDASGGTALSGTSPAIEGCFLATANLATATTTTQTNPVPMPVQWMYVLESGKLAAMDPATKKIAGAAPTDPIVGRIAFWTDDETSKVNINTSSEGTFWDRPMTQGNPTGYENTLNSSSPVQNEFQRYPGHPAMTSLSGIFPPLSGETTTEYNNRIADIIPRVTYKDAAGAYRGSQSGTVTVNGTSAPLVPDADRLFASVDEFLFGEPASSTRPLNPKDSGSAKFAQEDIEKTRFFLTASSRAPEVNLFNKPRITLWPLQANTANISDPENASARNAKDKLIAFCSTVGTKPYYFQRYNTFDQTKIRSGGSYDPSLLQTPIPSSQSPSMDWTNVPRNQELFAYLQSLASVPIPGLGGSLSGASGKYETPVLNQIITQMMDYIRSQVNTFHSKPANAVSADAPYYTYAPFSVNAATGNSSGWVTGQGQVVPLVISPPGASYQTKGFGRFSTITQASIVFYRTDTLQYVSNPATVASVPQDLPSVATTIPGKITVLDITPGVPLTIPPFPAYTPLAAWPLNAPAPTPTMRAVLLLQTFNSTPGLPPWSGNFRCRVTGLNSLQVKMGATTTPLGFPAQAANLVNGNEFARYYTTTALTGFEGCTEYYPGNYKTLGPTTPGGATEEQFYPFFSNAIPLTASTFDIIGGDIQIELYSGYSNPNGINASDLVQTIRMTIPSTSTGGAGLPVPNIDYTAGSYSSGNDTTINVRALNNQFTDQNVPGSAYNKRLAHAGYNSNGAPHNHRPYITHANNSVLGYRGDTVRSVQARYGFAGGGGDYRLIAGLPTVPESYFEGHGLIDPATDNLTYNTATGVAKGLHSLRAYPATGNNDDKSNGFYQNANNGTGLTYLSPASHGKLVAAVTYLDPMNSGGARPSLAPLAAQGVKGAYMDAAGTMPGDWDTGPGFQIDGPYINKADEGNSDVGWYVNGSYQNSASVVDTGASFSPNRQISSAVAFGSLPSGIDPSNPSASIPWKTLLFCRNPASGMDHPGFGQGASSPFAPPYTKPPDHAFLDLFTMPIVEPYAISEPFSTAGKVNMNYQILPFTYLTRDTGVRAVLRSTNIMAIDTASGKNYKASSNTDGLVPTLAPDFRYTLNLDETDGTLAGFQQRFSTGDIFRSASEICDIYLVPKYLVNTTTVAPGNPTYATMASWWLGSSNSSVDGYKLTGDNVREQPYGHIYPRLTTKSNTFTVHVQAQSIAKSKNTPADEFVEGKDQITGEFRGSFLIERYLDPNSDSLVKADGKTATDELDPDGMVGPYKFRVVSTKKFAP